MPENVVTRLKSLRAGEVSLVGRAANKRRFLILKSEEEVPMDDILQAILNTDLANEAEVDEIVKGMSDKAVVAVKAAMRMLHAYKEEIPKDILEKLGKVAGMVDPTEKAAPAACEKCEKCADLQKTADEAIAKVAVLEQQLKDAAPVQKSEEGLDLNTLPEEVRKQLEPVFKAQDELRAQNARLEEVLKAEQDQKRTAEFVAKAGTYENLPIDKDKFGPVLKAISDNCGQETLAAVEQVLKAADEGLHQAGSLKQQGKDVHSEGAKTSAWGRIEAMARQVIEKDNDGLSFHQAVARVCEQHRDLYEEAMQERIEPAQR